MSVPAAPLSVALVAGTRTRLKALERLLVQPGIVVCGEAIAPAEAEELVTAAGPAAVLLDLDLWGGGLETIERVMATRPTPIVVIGAAAEHPEAAIAAGAVDVVGGLDVAPGSAEYAAIVVRHLRVASRVRVITHPRGRLRRRGVLGGRSGLASDAVPGTPAQPEAHTSGSAGAASARTTSVPTASTPTTSTRSHGPRVVAIGASTGGPPALATILGDLPPALPAAVVVVQHMAEGFVEGLARWLDGVCPMPVMVAVEGERLQAGQVYLAPANQNLVVRTGHRVALQDPLPGQYHVPGVDVTFRSVAAVCGARATGVLLTGMGRDGAAGLRVLREAGAFTVGQDESTSVVWGMPAAAQELDAVDLELPLGSIAAAVVAAVLETSDAVSRRSGDPAGIGAGGPS